MSDADQRVRHRSVLITAVRTREQSGFPACRHTPKSDFGDVVVNSHPAATSVHVRYLPLFQQVRERPGHIRVTRLCYHLYLYPVLQRLHQWRGSDYSCSQTLFCRPPPRTTAPTTHGLPICRRALVVMSVGTLACTSWIFSGHVPYRWLPLLGSEVSRLTGYPGGPPSEPDLRNISGYPL